MTMADMVIQGGVESLSKVGGAAAGAKPVPVSGSGASFGEMLDQSIEKVDGLQKAADEAIQDLVTGQNKDLHNTMIAMEKADISFRLMMQVRNKIVEAYQEISRMAV